MGTGFSASSGVTGTCPANGDLGIDLADDGPSANDAGMLYPDDDEGPNGLQNYPEIGAATSSNEATTVEWTLDSLPLTDYRIEF
jgi:hypothetical protein